MGHHHPDRRVGPPWAGCSEQGLVGKFGPCKLFGDAALTEDKNAICKHACLFDLRRCEEDGKSLRCEVLQNAIDLPFRADIDAASWLIE